MIRLRDGLLLARTKLRTHKARTGIAVAISGLLFGVIVFVICVSQGILDSLNRFNSQGLRSRTIMLVGDYRGFYDGFNPYDHSDDQDFIKEVEAAYKDMVAKKTTLAKKYDISYDAAVEDPSPIIVNTATKKKSLSDTGIESKLVQQLVVAKQRANTTPFDIRKLLADYKSYTILDNNYTVMPAQGALTYMKKGKENFDKYNRDDYVLNGFSGADQNGDPQGLDVLNSSLTESFVSNKSYDPNSGEIPVIVQYSVAEKLLNMKTLPFNASAEQKLDRMNEVKSRVGEITAAYCYRNEASSNLLATAVAESKEIEENQNNPDYIKPNVIYTLPADDECGAVTVSRDNRTSAQKKQDANRVAYEKELGTYIGEPVERKIAVRGVGVSGSSVSGDSNWSIASIVQSVLSSDITMGFSIPADLFEKVPAEYRPDYIFAKADNDQSEEYISLSSTYIVEFKDKTEARSLMQRYGNGESGTTFAAQFGSNSLIVDEAQDLLFRFISIAIMIIGTIAAIILAGIIGRTVSEGRRETAIFRAIGAKRSDIANIYGMFTLSLAARIATSALLTGLIGTLIIEILFWSDATLGARLSYSEATYDTQFHFIGFAPLYLIMVIGVIFIVSIIAAIIPIITNARRNPIKDMREDG